MILSAEPSLQSPVCSLKVQPKAEAKHWPALLNYGHLFLIDLLAHVFNVGEKLACSSLVFSCRVLESFTHRYSAPQRIESFLQVPCTSRLYTMRDGCGVWFALGTSILSIGLWCLLTHPYIIHETVSPVHLQDRQPHPRVRANDLPEATSWFPQSHKVQSSWLLLFPVACYAVSLIKSGYLKKCKEQRGLPELPMHPVKEFSNSMTVCN